MQNLYLRIHKFIFSFSVFFSSFVLFHGCFEKLMNHASLNVSDQTSLLILGEERCGKNTWVCDWTRNVKSLNLFLSKPMNQHTIVHIPVVR